MIDIMGLTIINQAFFQFAQRSEERAESVESTVNADVDPSAPDSEEAEISDKAFAEAQQGIDMLFDRDHLKNEWIAPACPTVLGELMDTSFPFAFLLPSNPELLAAWPGPDVEQQLEKEEQDRKRRRHDISGQLSGDKGHFRSASRASIGNRGAMEWRLRTATVRAVTLKMLTMLDGSVRRLEHEVKLPALSPDGDPASHSLDSDVEEDEERTHVLPQLSMPTNSFTKRPKRHSKFPRESSGTETVAPSYRLRDSSQTPEPNPPDLV
jgi:hypothetical protein